MKRGIILSGIIFVLALCSGFAGDQSIVKETRNVSGFTKISFGVAGDLTINLGSEYKVELEGEKKVLEDIITEVTGGKLVIKKENWRLNLNEKIKVTITMPSISGLGVSGSGRAEIMDAVKAESLDLSVSGSGKLYTGNVQTDDLSCSISGSGDIIVSGEGNAAKADISISGSGNYNGESMKIASCGVSISGSGNCSCNVTGSLRASVSGSGNVSYNGDPKIDARISGSGHVRSR